MSFIGDVLGQFIVDVIVWIVEAIVSIIADYGHRIEQKLSKKVKPTFGKRKTKYGGTIKKKK